MTLNSLQQLFTSHGSDKGTEFHDFGRWYDNVFKPFRDTPVKVLEIGVLQGNSLAALRAYFHHPDAHVIGMDIDQSCSKFEDVIIGNAADPKVLASVIEEHGRFDIIIDDGSHTNVDVINSFKTLFPMGLREGGVYVVEDLVCWRSPGHVKPTHPNHMDYFCRFVYGLQQADFHISTCSNPDKLQRSYPEHDPQRFVDTMTFGPGFVAITKRERVHWKQTSI
jgi:hypothetical protein